MTTAHSAGSQCDGPNGRWALAVDALAAAVLTMFLMSCMQPPNQVTTQVAPGPGSKAAARSRDERERSATSDQKTARDGGTVRLKILGVRLVGGPAIAGRDDLRAFNWPRGTTIAAWMSVDGYHTLQLLDDLTTLKVASDDVERHSLRSSEEHLPRIQTGGVSDETNGMVLEFEVPGLPASSATHVHLKGVVGLALGRDIRTVRHKVGAIGEDSFFVTGPITWKPTYLGLRDVPVLGERFAAAFDVEGPFQQVVRIGAHSTDGPIRIIGEATSVEAGAATVTYLLEREVTDLELEVEFASAGATAEVPIDLQVGLGSIDEEVELTWLRAEHPEMGTR